MSNNYLEKLNEVFDSVTPSQEKVLGLMDETMSFFQEIKSKLESNDPESQRVAFEETMEMKRLLESKMQSLAEKTGLNLAELAAFANNPNNMTKEERDTLEAAKAKLQGLQEMDEPSKNNPFNNTQKIIG